MAFIPDSDAHKPSFTLYRVTGTLDLKNGFNVSYTFQEVVEGKRSYNNSHVMINKSRLLQLESRKVKGSEFFSYEVYCLKEDYSRAVAEIKAQLENDLDNAQYELGLLRKFLN